MEFLERPPELLGQLLWPVTPLRGEIVVVDGDLPEPDRQCQGLHGPGARGHHRRPLLRRAPRTQRAARQGGIQLLMVLWPAFVAAPVAIFAPAAHAAVYLSVEQAQQAIFPGARFTMEALALPDAARRKLWRVSEGGWFIVDAGPGKH